MTAASSLLLAFVSGNERAKGTCIYPRVKLSGTPILRAGVCAFRLYNAKAGKQFSRAERARSDRIKRRLPKMTTASQRERKTYRKRPKGH